MTSIHNIQSALRDIPGRDFALAAKDLLAALGYESAKTLAGQTGEVDDFIATFPALNSGTASEIDFLSSAKSAQLLFQVTDAEISAAASHQAMLFDASESFEQGRENSFLFVAVELNDDSYPRGNYARFTRELNKRLSAAPTVVLFRTSNERITLAFVHRRANKRDPNRSVLGSVSLIREINPADPHRAHLDILQDLSLDHRLKWMDLNGKPHSFDGLLAAWLDALDTEELNRRFYRELFSWFERAVKVAKFPTGEAKTLPAEEHVIRLITRLLFIWFIKEKGLVAPDLFIEAQAAKLLKDYERDAGDSYYRAVIQNLFFATLNTEIERRGFSSLSNTTHRDFSRYRFRNEIADEDALLDLFSKTPFINGGLFDCLDTEKATRDGGFRIDCFSDVHYRKLSIPNRLFFDESVSARGLIPLFNRYKFTVEENTPTEQEVALDPELLGKVFENLLAAYNPETRETARKQTGSYYTPRPVVDYMVDEALVESLAEKVQPTDGDGKSWRDRLHYLLDYADAFDDAEQIFTPAERQGVIRAISEIQVLDPAVGSGAFPMAVLHKLTLALRRLDLHNRYWEDLQKELAGHRATVAFDTRDQAERDAELKDISDTFEKYRDSDFGRKLYLIQNSIFGVDIQTIACQIAKLRFFISLAIEQQPDETADNFGIKPLPNLETRFVAANTLLALGGLNRQLVSTRANDLQKRLKENRERYFHANTRQLKLKYIDADKRLRNDLAAELRKVGLAADEARKVADWDPYDQNANAQWFDAEYMFGIADGFSIVIGNPPYIQLQKNGGKMGRLYKDAGFTTFVRTGDIYQLFFEEGCQLLVPKQGILSYITSNSWLKAEYGKSTRRWFAEGHTPLRLIEMGKDVFENTIVDTSVLITKCGKSRDASKAVDMDRLPSNDFPPAEKLWGQVRPNGEVPWSILSPLEQSVMDKMERHGTPLRDWNVKINRGITTGYNKAFIIDDATRVGLVDEDPKSAEIIKPVLRGKDIRRYMARWADQWLIDTHNGYAEVTAINIKDYTAIKEHLDCFYPQLARRYDKGRTPYNLRNCSFHEDFSREKLFWMDMSPEGRFAYSDTELYCNDKGFIMTGESLKYLCAFLNSSLIMWMMENTALTTGMGLMQWKKFAVERLPIPKISAARQRPFIQLVDEILNAKAADPDADTWQQETEIDKMVYDLYALTENEIAAVEFEDAALVRAMEEGLQSGRGGMKELREILQEWDEA